MSALAALCSEYYTEEPGEADCAGHGEWLLGRPSHRLGVQGGCEGQGARLRDLVPLGCPALPSMGWCSSTEERLFHAERVASPGPALTPAFPGPRAAV